MGLLTEILTSDVGNPITRGGRDNGGFGGIGSEGMEAARVESDGSIGVEARTLRSGRGQIFAHVFQVSGATTLEA